MTPEARAGATVRDCTWAGPSSAAEQCSRRQWPVTQSGRASFKEGSLCRIPALGGSSPFLFPQHPMCPVLAQDSLWGACLGGKRREGVWCKEEPLVFLLCPRGLWLWGPLPAQWVLAQTLNSCGDCKPQNGLPVLREGASAKGWFWPVSVRWGVTVLEGLGSIVTGMWQVRPLSLAESKQSRREVRSG